MYFTPINHLKVICKISGSGKNHPFRPFSTSDLFKALIKPKTPYSLKCQKQFISSLKPFKSNLEQIWERIFLASFELLTLKSHIDWAKSEQMQQNMALNAHMTSTLPIPNKYAWVYNVIYEKNIVSRTPLYVSVKQL